MNHELIKRSCNLDAFKAQEEQKRLMLPPDRTGQLFVETEEVGRMGLVIAPPEGRGHPVLLLNTGERELWYEDDDTGSWDCYLGLA
jgi:hypothetical protein